MPTKRSKPSKIIGILIDMDIGKYYKRGIRKELLHTDCFKGCKPSNRTSVIEINKKNMKAYNYPSSI